MAKIVAVEWERGEARVAVASRRGQQALVERLVAIPLPGPADNGQLAPDDLGALLASRIEPLGTGASECLVALGRTGVELRELSLPPVPDDELAEVVRFQATRQFSTLTDQSALDFLPLQDDPGAPRQVLAAALSAPQLARVQQAIGAAGMRPIRLLFRPCAAASLVMQCPEMASCPRYLLVHVGRREADLVAVVDRRIVFLRSALVPSDPDTLEGREALGGEVRRTLAAVHTQLAGPKLEALVVCGSGPARRRLAEHLGARLGLPARCVDPSTVVEFGNAAGEEPPEDPGRFTALLGMLADECSGAPPALDFLHPRRVPDPPRRGRLVVMAALVVLALLLGIGGLVGMSLREMDRRIVRMRGELADLEEENESLQPYQDHAEQLDGWVAADPTWLEEFYRLAERFPEVGRARLTRLEIRSLDADVGHMYLKGFADKPETITQIEQSLRDPYRHVYGRRSQMGGDESAGGWSFDATVEFHVPAPDPLESEPTEAVASDGKAEPDAADAAQGRLPSKPTTTVMARPEGLTP